MLLQAGVIFPWTIITPLYVLVLSPLYDRHPEVRPDPAPAWQAARARLFLRHDLFMIAAFLALHAEGNPFRIGPSGFFFVFSLSCFRFICPLSRL